MDDIWDDSAIVPRSPARAVARPLFVASPSQSPEKPTAASARRVTTSGASTSKAATATAHEAELDEIFADVENLNNANRASKKARRPPRSDSNTGKAKVLLSDDDTDEDDAAIIAAANKKADEKAEEQKKPRKKPVKLDEDRLLGKTGFPALIEQHKKFKPSGKGNEIKDLKRLLQMYQFWAVKMYPRSDFRETATKVEKLCHTKRMINALNSYKNDMKYPDGQPMLEIEPDSDEEKGDDDYSKPPDTSEPPPIRAPDFDGAGDDPEDDYASTKFPSRPSTSMSVTSGGGVSEFEDMMAADAAAREAAKARERERLAAAGAATSSRKAAPSGPMTDEWDLDALLAEEEETQSHFNKMARNEDTDYDDYPMDVDLTLESAASLSAPAKKQTQTPPEDSYPDEDEEMWDMIHSIHDN